MSDEYDVGYGKPPRQHQFKPGNKAAKSRKSAKKALSMPEILDRALRTRRKIKRGGQVIDMAVAEILSERLVQTISTGNPRELALVVGLIERYLPDALASTPEALEITYHRAEGSTVALPPADLWKGTKP